MPPHVEVLCTPPPLGSRATMYPWRDRTNEESEISDPDPDSLHWLSLAPVISRKTSLAINALPEH